MGIMEYASSLYLATNHSGSLKLDTKEGLWKSETQKRLMEYGKRRFLLYGETQKRLMEYGKRRFLLYGGQRNAKRNLISSDGNTLPALKSTGGLENCDERET